MFSIDELNSEGIRQWERIKEKYIPSPILLGNGFSLNFSDTLRYKFLYEFFIKESSSISQSLFEVFDTKNFEQILSNIETAKIVCDTLKISSEEFEIFKNEIRTGLINSINKIHPTHESINQDRIKLVAEQFNDFKDIFTTNYDLFLYYLILETRKYGDHFFKEYNSNYLCYETPDTYSFTKHIYYLHGALFLFENDSETYKIKNITQKNGFSNRKWLLDEITEQIQQNNYPLFISEGKSDTKYKSILSNNYLRFCLSKFENNSAPKLVIYGQSLSPQDEHLVKIIDNKNTKIAISIKTDNVQTLKEIVANKNRISSLFSKADYEFYDASSLFNFSP